MTDEEQLEALRKRASELGIEVKHQWGIPKLTEVIEAAENGAPDPGNAAPEGNGGLAELKAMMAQVLAENQELKQRLDDLPASQPTEDRDNSEMVREMLIEQARGLDVPFNEAWGITRLRQAIEEHFAEVKNAADARQMAYERSTKFFRVRVTRFGDGKVETGKGKQTASEGHELRVDEATANILEGRGFVEIQGEVKDDG